MPNKELIDAGISICIYNATRAKYEIYAFEHGVNVLLKNMRVTTEEVVNICKA